MPPKLGHKKTRTGCFQCRVRRVKCDEAKPRCKSCVRHAKTCEYPPGLAGASRSRRGTSPRNASTQSNKPSDAEALSPDSPTASVAPSRSPPAQTSPPPLRPSTSIVGLIPRNPNRPYKDVVFPDHSTSTYSLFDMQLLHYFCTDFDPSPLALTENLTVWHKVIPSLAYHSDYLMKAVLAVAALHMALSDSKSERRLLEIGREHFTQGIALAQPNMAEVTEANCHCLFGFSSLITIYQFVIHRLDPSKNAIDSFVDSCHMIRGCAAIIIDSRIWIASGPLRPLLGMESELKVVSMATRSRSCFDRLASTLERSLVNNQQELYIRGVCLSALTHLEDLYEQLLGADMILENGLTLRWPVKVQVEFLKMIADRVKPALAVLAFFCPLMQDFHGMWMFSDWSTWLVGEIIEELGRESHFGRLAVEAFEALNDEVTEARDFPYPVDGSEPVKKNSGVRS